MIELDPLAWGNVLATLRVLPINTLFVQSVLCGHADGRIWVDDARDPHAFYALHPCGMSLLWGRASRGRWLAWLHDHLLASTRPAEWLQVYPDTWVATVEAVLGDRLVSGDSLAGLAGGALKCTRVNFAFDPKAYLRERARVVTAMARATIVPTTEDMFSRIEDGVVPKRFWRSATQFVRQAGGFSMIVDREIAATAFCSFRNGTQLEIGIETVAHHRARGHAQLVACALIDDCLRRGLEPVWACRLENAASFHLASELGFVPAAHVPYYRLPCRDQAPERSASAAS